MRLFVVRLYRCVGEFGCVADVLVYISVCSIGDTL